MAQLISGVNDLATTHPGLVAEWHPTKNDDLTPQGITCGSNKIVRWLGLCGHEWEATVKSRAKHGSGCPFCSGKKIIPGYNDLASKNPALASEWHPNKNIDLTPSSVTVRSDKKVWWLGKCGHEWQAKIYHRSNGRGCPFCSNQKVIPGFNDLATTNPELAAQWHPIKNGDLIPSEVTTFSNKKVWWLGKCGHEWKTQVNYRSVGSGCPICKGKSVLIGYNDLLTTHPRLASEWHPTKNGTLTPLEVTYGSQKKVWWRGECGHEWQAIIGNRTKGSDCPVCWKRKQNRSLPGNTVHVSVQI